MHRKTAALFVCLTLAPGVLSPGSALAQDRGSEADQEACTPDVFRLCSDFVPDEGRILACLQGKRAELSPACGPVIFPPDHKARTAQATTRRIHHGKLARSASN